jgi:hypothetical protein
MSRFPDARELAVTTVAAIRSLWGTIPRDLQYDFVTAGARLPMSAFAPRVRVPRAPRVVRGPCTGTTAKGAPCKNKACADHGMCLIHYNKSARATDSTAATWPPCTGTTAKGEPCKCPRYRSLEMCWRHAKKGGLLPDVPSDCAICMNEMAPSERTKTKCGHYFHTACLTEWATRRGSTGGTTRRRTVKAPCPMCRAPFTLPAPPPPPLTGPAWYTMDNVAPTVMTSESEWIRRLRAVPINPVMSPETLHHYAGYAGRALLSYVHDHNGEFPNETFTRMLMESYRIAPTVSYADL